jgi:large subunit ribosomal protein L31
MKKEIHPKYYKNAQVKCACGNVFTVGSTKESIEIEICSQCHPFYTGKEKLIDALGRVEKFKKRLEKQGGYQKKAEKKAKRKAQNKPSSEKRQKKE